MKAWHWIRCRLGFHFNGGQIYGSCIWCHFNIYEDYMHRIGKSDDI